MAYNLMDYFNAFSSYSKERELSASARSLYFELLNEFNRARWPGELCFSDSVMASWSGVKSRETLHDVKNLLKEFKWINFRAGKNRKSVYELLTDNLPTKSAENRQLENSSLQISDNLQTKLTDFRQPNEQVDRFPTTCKSSSQISDNLPVNLPVNHTDNLPDNLGGFPMERTRVDSRQEDNRQSSLNRADACEDVDELIACWEAAGGAKLNMLILAKFKALLRTHDLSSLKSAIERAGLANNGNYGFSYNFFLSKLNAKNDGKEGDTSGDDDVEEHDPRDVWEFSNW